MDVYSEEELFKAIKDAYINSRKIQILGNGKHAKKSKADEYIYTRKMEWFEIKGNKVEALAGADVVKIRKEASENGLLLPTLYDGTVGGLLATNEPSPLSTTYGKPRDFTSWVTVLTPYGGVKWNFLIGSRGILGAVSRAELKLFPKPKKVITYEKSNVTEDEVSKLIELNPLVLLVDYDREKFNIHASFEDEKNVGNGYSKDEGVPVVEVADESREIIVEGDSLSEFVRVVEISKPVYAYWVYKSGLFKLYDANVEALSQHGVKYYTRDNPKEVYLKLKRLLDFKNIFV
ncbi:FAD-binding protein [Sulfurisphaera javensis]|uniref:FAD-binding protein n=1 Tax=Sulfurisphaera javensis TaxID=2049879 RepID=A0AAT9GSQ1_9CREN